MKRDPASAPAAPSADRGSDGDPGADAAVVFLRDPAGGISPRIGGEITDEVRARAREEQKRRKAEFEYRLAGALARSGKLPKKLTAALGHGAANLMLAMIVQGELRPVTAKEAADVAKVAHEIARSAQGRGTGDGPMSDADRAALLEQADQFEKALVERAKAAAGDGLLAGAPATDEEVPEPARDWDFDEVRGDDGP